MKSRSFIISIFLLNFIIGISKENENLLKTLSITNLSNNNTAIV